MYSGSADVAFYHKYLPLPDDQLDVSFNVGVTIMLTEFQPWIAQLDFAPDVVGVTRATDVRVRLPMAWNTKARSPPGQRSSG